jgi:serralysin
MEELGAVGLMEARETAGAAWIRSMAPNAGNNVDQITDFTVAEDRIELSGSIFKGLTSGALAASAFKIGTAASTADQHILYDKATGALLYDVDGSGAAAAIKFATMAAGAALTADHFLVL